MTENLKDELARYELEKAELKKEIARIREERTGKKRYTSLFTIVDEKADPRIKDINLRLAELSGLINEISRRILMEEMRGCK